MNTEQKTTVEKAEAEVRQIRHTLEELNSFGWKATETAKPLMTFDQYKARLGLNKAAIENCSPLDKSYQSKLSTLLSEENLLVESVAKLSAEARQALTDEELAFFGTRDGLFAGLGEQIGEADSQIAQALSWLIEGLQNRWALMQGSAELAQRVHDISVKHSTPESFGQPNIQLPKPFAKMNRSEERRVGK